LNYAADAGIRNVILESDASMVCAALCSAQFDRAPIGVLFREIKYLMYLNFVDVKAQYTPRSCNSLAHHLAGVGVSTFRSPASDDCACLCFEWPSDRKHTMVKRSYVFLSTKVRVFAVGNYKQVAGECSFSVLPKDQTPCVATLCLLL
ncbi:hypothetical protein BAE44_0011383, partial [Dichanthelium oligosanthes]